jgi:hypothetical protein
MFDASFVLKRLLADAKANNTIPATTPMYAGHNWRACLAHLELAICDLEAVANLDNAVSAMSSSQFR